MGDHMDLNFLKELDEKISNLGTDTLWKRKIGGRVIWFAPVPYKGQQKINEILSRATSDTGASIIGEAKRLTLSYSIMGVDDIDFRDYRKAGEVFPVVDPRLRTEVKVTLDRYIYLKMDEWGSEFMDNAFDVLADLMESFKRENLKEVKFENAKEPLDELTELEVRVSELRRQLDMPKLIEAAEPVEEDAETPKETPVSLPPKFDPFKPVNESPAEPIRPNTPIPQSLVQPPVVQNRIEGAGAESSPDRPFMATPSATTDVVEERSKLQPTPLVIDQVQENRNPRFRPTAR